MKNKKTKMIFIYIIAVFLLFVHFYLPRFIMEIKNPFIVLLRKEKERESFDTPAINGKELSFKAYDGLTMSAHLVYSEVKETKGTIILLHGIRSRKESYVYLSKRLAKLGFNTVALDLRAHGKSEGIFCTFGVKEKKDISALIDYLNQNENIANNIGIWGRSLGGAVTLQAMAIDKRLEFGIVESTFSNFKTITNDYFELILGFRFELFSSYLASRAESIADFKDAMPINASKEITQPILVIHGSEDERVNISYGKANYENIKSIEKEFISVDKAKHMDVWEVGGEPLFDQIVNFILNKGIKLD